MTTQTQTIRLTGSHAIRYAVTHGLTLEVHANPLEEARTGVSPSDARDVCREDPSLVYLDVPGAPAAIRQNQTKAQAQGIADARVFAAEHPDEVEGALAPGQGGADEALVNSLGPSVAARFLGARPGDEAFAGACGEYSRAFAGELARIARTTEAGQ